MNSLSKKITSYALWACTLSLFGMNLTLAQPVELPVAKLAGISKLRVFGFEIYEARLWVSPGFKRSDYSQSACALELTYLRNFKGAVIAERSLKEMRRVEPFSETLAKQWLADMTAVFPNVRVDDRLTGIYTPGAGLRLLFNDKPLAELKDPVFARVFMGIWLSPKTSEPAMRDALLADAEP